jgi:hypothetical protein
MKRYLRLLLAFAAGVALQVSTMVSIHFLQIWLPANGVMVSEQVFLGVSCGAMVLAFAVGAKLCLREARRLGPARPGPMDRMR